MIGRIILASTITLALSSIASATAESKQASAEQIYGFGTDAGIRYISEHLGALRTTLINEECGFLHLSKIVGEKLPNSQVYSLATQELRSLSAQDRMIAAQVARSYIFGVETGIRTEFRRQPEGTRQLQCEVSATAAGNILSDIE